MYGNLLDLLVRNARDGQTIGLPVSPQVAVTMSAVFRILMPSSLSLGRFWVARVAMSASRRGTIACWRNPRSIRLA